MTAWRHRPQLLWAPWTVTSPSNPCNGTRLRTPRGQWQPAIQWTSNWKTWIPMSTKVLATGIAWSTCKMMLAIEEANLAIPLLLVLPQPCSGLPSLPQQRQNNTCAPESIISRTRVFFYAASGRQWWNVVTNSPRNCHVGSLVLISFAHLNRLVHGLGLEIWTSQSFESPEKTALILSASITIYYNEPFARVEGWASSRHQKYPKVKNEKSVSTTLKVAQWNGHQQPAQPRFHNV